MAGFKVYRKLGLSAAGQYFAIGQFSQSGFLALQIFLP